MIDGETQAEGIRIRPGVGAEFPAPMRRPAPGPAINDSTFEVTAESRACLTPKQNCDRTRFSSTAVISRAPLAVSPFSSCGLKFAPLAEEAVDGWKLEVENQSKADIVDTEAREVDLQDLRTGPEVYV